MELIYYYFVISLATSSIITGVMAGDENFCSRSHWRCRDGTCIVFDGKCNGTVECPDGSDETIFLCRRTRCRSEQFQCSYGACVNGTAPCNGQQECADNSDELQPKCFSEDKLELVIAYFSKTFYCQSRQVIDNSRRCDGTAHCEDESDESFHYCAGRTCNSSSFQCAYGACVHKSSVCDGKRDCNDGSDETNDLCAAIAPKPLKHACVLPNHPEGGYYKVVHAPKAGPGHAFKTVQIKVACNFGYKLLEKNSLVSCENGKWQGSIPTCIPLLPDLTVAKLRDNYCSTSEWQCKDGMCINYEKQCDGLVDCHDGSDETHALCRRILCLPGQFQCTYGACVDSTAACNGQQECADNSDELQPKCFNGTTIQLVRDQFKCRNGQLIPTSNICDGAEHCVDGSDETLFMCAVKKCPSNSFQCAYGACVSEGSNCDGIPNCADDSDEQDELCNDASESDRRQVVYPTILNNNNTCILPEYPQNGNYTVVGDPKAGWGYAFEAVMINVMCASGYKLIGDSSLTCDNGLWTNHLPECVSSSPLLTTSKHQGSCRKDSQCGDGTCIDMKNVCNGVKDCPDGTDEIHARCRMTRCLPDQFRCTYGACVNGTAPCNGKTECADNSDELQPKCLIGKDEVRLLFKCRNEQLIPATGHCNGAIECTDGSDETLRVCAAMKCPPNSFQCAYGACVAEGSDCDGKFDCADGSDESKALCNVMGEEIAVRNSKASGACEIPVSPQNSSYRVAVASNPDSAQASEFFIQINVTCDPGYGVIGKNTVMCYKGFWLGKIPECIPFCRLNKHPSVEYRCLFTEDGSDGSRECQDYEPTGTIVRPECRSPNYHYNGVLKFMECINGDWDYVAICTPECGRVTPSGDGLIIGGRVAKHGEVPWHAGIYRKTTTPYRQICGGTLVTNMAVISAAHCFWSDIEKSLPASRFAVAVGKLYRPWGNPHDVEVQKSDVREIKMPARFQGASMNFQDDIAIVRLKTAIVFKPYIRPVCIDFDIDFDRQQLKNGTLAKVAGWGLTSENGNASQVLRVVDLPYVAMEQCVAATPLNFRQYITSDKICAGYANGTALCDGDSGGGLAFPDRDRGAERYYLRGVTSAASINENKCNAYTLIMFTQISKHKYFIKEWISL